VSHQSFLKHIVSNLNLRFRLYHANCGLPPATLTITTGITVKRRRGRGGEPAVVQGRRACGNDYVMGWDQASTPAARLPAIQWVSDTVAAISVFGERGRWLSADLNSSAWVRQCSSVAGR
jgi:hypothetical protein